MSTHARVADVWSHARRYLFRALDVAPEARDALDMILELFRVERDAIERDVSGTDEHLAMRVRRSQPVLDQIKAWTEQQKPRHLPEGPMGAALRYISNQWQPLTVFMRDPKIPIHNNASESALRTSLWRGRTRSSSATRKRLATSPPCTRSCRQPSITASTRSRTSRTS